MSIHDHQVHQGVVIPGGHPPDTLAAPVLGAVGIAGNPLDVAPLAQRDHYVLVGNKLFRSLLAHFFVFYASAAGVAKVLLELAGLLLDFVKNLARVCQQGLQVADGLQQFLVLVQQPLPFQGGQAAQLHVQDGLGLDLAKVELGHQVGAGRLCVVGGAYDLNHLVHDVQSEQEALEDVVTVPGPLQQELGTAANDLLAVLHKQSEGPLQGKHLGLACHQGQQYGVEGTAHRRMPVQVVQNNVGLRIAAEFNDNSHSSPVRFVPNIGNSLYSLVPYHLGDLLYQVGLIDLIGQFGDDYAIPTPANLLNLGLGLHYDAAPAGVVGINYALGAADRTVGGKVRSWYQLHQVVGNAVGVVNDVTDGVTDFTQIVGRQVGSHAHRDSGCAIDQQVRHPAGQDLRFVQ